MENWQVALVALGAMLVGLVIPVVVQFRSTLRSILAELRILSQRLNGTLEDARITARRARQFSDALEGKERSVADLIDITSNLAKTLDRLPNIAQIATAAATAVAAGVRAFSMTQPGHVGQADTGTEPVEGNGHKTQVNRELENNTSSQSATTSASQIGRN